MEVLVFGLASRKNAKLDILSVFPVAPFQLSSLW